MLLGLVSGAMEGAARTKLVPANLNRFFIFGAYGSDSPDRAELTRLAIEKAARLHTGLTPSQVFVVGDTPRDIDAATGQAEWCALARTARPASFRSSGTSSRSPSRVPTQAIGAPSVAPSTVPSRLTTRCQSLAFSITRFLAHAPL